MREIKPARLKLSSGVENEAEDEGTETNCRGDGRNATAKRASRRKGKY
jgi:hypothetical protein